MTRSTKKFILLAALALAACSKESHSNSSNSSAANADKFNQNFQGSSCSFTKVDGSPTEGGGEGLTVGLDNSYFGKAEESVYIVGAMPNDYTVETQDATHQAPSETDLLKRGAPWKWTIAPEKDASGQWTKLTMYREIYDASVGGAYHYDEREVGYGQKFQFVDTVGGLNIACKLPNQPAK